MDQHPSHRELADFLAGELSDFSRNRRIVRHLLAGCPSCRERLQDLETERRLPGFVRRRLLGLRSARLDPSSLDYESAFRGAERSLNFFLADDRPVGDPPGALLAELGRWPEGQNRASQILSPERSALPFLTRWLIEKSHSCRYADPEKMLQWALMARIAAEACSAEVAGSTAKLADLRARTEAQLANTLRVLGRSVLAEATMRSAWEQLGRGTGDPLLRAWVLQRSNSLMTLQSDFTTALDQIREAAGIFGELGLKHQCATAEVKEAITCIQSNEPAQATRLLERALPWIDPAEDSYLPVVARNNLIRSSIDLGETSKALAIYLETQDSACDGRQTAILLKLQWQEGKLLIALGLTHAAERSLARVRSSFLERGLGHELVLVTRDLVGVHLELGKSHAVAREVAETTAQVQAWRSGPEVLQALGELQSFAG